MLFDRKLLKYGMKPKYMKTLIVTASSKSKRSEDEAKFIPPDRTFADSLQAAYKNKLIQSRRSLRNELNIEKGADLGDGTEPSGKLLYLPAYKRYSGRTYSRIENDAWNILQENPDEYDCVILSALYGIIRFNEPIRDYVIKQVDNLPNGQRIGTYWKNQGASQWLLDYITRNNIDDVKFVLSTSYSNIIKRDHLIEKLQNDHGIKAEDKQFKEAGGMKSMLVRGQYINDLLLDH